MPTTTLAENRYTAFNPYKNTTAGVATGNDLSPRYTEITVGYNYVFIPTKQSAGKLKLDYVMRSKNFLTPRARPTTVSRVATASWPP